MLVFLSLVWIPAALAGEGSSGSTAAGSTAAGSTAVVPRPIAGHPVLELRGGVDTTALGRDKAPLPTICAEVTPLDRFSLEACGNGAGVLHTADVPDTMHLRLRYAAARVRQGATEAALMLGAGMTEVASGIDAPGFRFGPATTPDQVEAAGPELSAGVKARWWPHSRAYVTFEIGGGAAWIPAAPTVVGTPGPVVGFGGVTVGAGF
jgi:hypothetical protein